MNIKEEYHNWMRSDKFIPTGLGAWSACAELMQKEIDKKDAELAALRGFAKEILFTKLLYLDEYWNTKQGIKFNLLDDQGNSTALLTGESE